jgi:CRP/FNR family transcriptional regulator, cyclic AMP receptor protein
MFESFSSALNVFSDPQLSGRTIALNHGQIVCDEQTTADNVYYITRGQIRLYASGPNDSTRLIEILGPGEWFGVAALAGAALHQDRAIAIDKTNVTEVAAQQLLSLLSQQPVQFVELTRQLAQKLLAANQEAGRYVFEDCTQRLIGALLRFSRSAASTQQADGVVLRITHNQLALAIGVARETVSLALTQLRQQNLLRTGRNQLMFNPESLRHIGSPAAQQPAIQNAA